MVMAHMLIAQHAYTKHPAASAQALHDARSSCGGTLLSVTEAIRQVFRVTPTATSCSGSHHSNSKMPCHHHLPGKWWSCLHRCCVCWSKHHVVTPHGPAPQKCGVIGTQAHDAFRCGLSAATATATDGALGMKGLHHPV
jgi:hypothetical protein